ncbi:replication initiation protein [Hyphomicrobium sp.]|uniref:replication initiation protein n=1 Tax=Hyphomicrobium sp. TaxID=82 RepID=UPI0025B8DF10|nr:replication initiation protein [Hyphomicrobium sp.]MCC7252385.1 replication initiation protein [Hyphomicrobium sp.]
MQKSSDPTTTHAQGLQEHEPAKLPSRPLATDIKVTGEPLDPGQMGRIIKPRELVDVIELTPLNRSETLLYNQLLANAWNNIRTAPVHKVLKASLRGSHQSNDRLEESFDKLMGAWAKIRARDPATGTMATFRVHLLGTNKEEDHDDGYFYYTFPPDLLAVIQQSKAWATIKTHIMYALRSKYSIRLYEMVERRIGMMKQHEQFSVDELRAMLGVPEGKLERFAEFNKHCLKPALGEVNHLTDFWVEVMAIKKGRAVEKLQLAWFRKSEKDMQAAFDERERSRIGRQARLDGSVELIRFDAVDS